MAGSENLLLQDLGGPSSLGEEHCDYAPLTPLTALPVSWMGPW